MFFHAEKLSADRSRGINTADRYNFRPKCNGYHLTSHSIPIPSHFLNLLESIFQQSFIGILLPGISINFEIVPLSNFGGQGLHLSGSEKSMSPFGDI